MTNAISKNRMREFFPTNWVEFDSLLGQVFGPNAGRAIRAGYTPAGFWQDDQAYHLELDLPGVAREDVSLTLEKDVLQIVAERKQREEHREGMHEERVYGKMTRTLRLPEAVDPDSITAELNDGVLRVTLTKSAETQPKRIEVN